MAIALVQTAPVANGTGASSTTFSGNTTSGNTVILNVNSYSSSAVAISSNSPVFGGSSFPSAVKLFDKLQPAGTGNIYVAVWMFPNVPAGTTVGVTIVNGTVDSNVGATAREFSGLGPTPVTDRLSTGLGNSAGPADSGTTGAITSAPELVWGASILFGSSETGPGAPWTNETITSGFGVDGYQIVTSSGGTFDYQATLGGTNNWVAGVVTIAAGGSSVSSSTNVIKPFRTPGQRGPLKTLAAPTTPVQSVSVNTTGVAAAVTVAGGIGTLQSDQNFTGVAAAITVTGGIGTPFGAISGSIYPQPVNPGRTWKRRFNKPANQIVSSTQNSFNISGSGASVIVASGIGAISADQNLTGIAASVTIAGGIGAPSGNASIIGVAAAISVDGGIGTVTATTSGSRYPQPVNPGKTWSRRFNIPARQVLPSQQVKAPPGAPSSGVSPIVPVVFVSNNAASGSSSYAATVNATTRTGDTYVVSVSTNSTTTVTSVTDTQGNSYAPITSITRSGATLWLYQSVRAKALTNGVDTVTVNLNTTTSNINMIGIDLPSSCALDVTTTSSGVTSTLQSYQLSGLNSPDEMILAFSNVSTVVPTWQSPFTSLILKSGNGAGSGVAAYAQVNNTAPVTVQTNTPTTSPSWVSVGLSFIISSAYVPARIAPGKTWSRRFNTPAKQTLPSTQRSFNVSGVGASVVVGGGAGTLEGDQNITGVAASITVAGGTGTVFGGGGGAANVNGVAAAITVDGGIGTVSSGQNLTGIAASVTITGSIGTLSSGANITGIAATITVQGGAGIVSSSQKLTGIGASVVVTAGAGIPAGTSGASVNITGVAASVIVSGGAGVTHTTSFTITMSGTISSPRWTETIVPAPPGEKLTAQGTLTLPFKAFVVS